MIGIFTARPPYVEKEPIHFILFQLNYTNQNLRKKSGGSDEMPAHWVKWVNLLAFIAVIVVNGLAESIPLNGKTTGEISAMFPVLITPAPYTFSIWGLIYVLLLCYVIYQLLPRNKHIVNLVGSAFLFSCIFNISWVLLWHYLYSQVWLSLIAMIGLLLSIIFMFTNVREARDLHTKDRIFVQLPFSIYLGWISVATIVNTSVVLYDLGWNGLGLSDTAWTVIILAVGSILAWLVGIPYRTPAYMLVFVWAYAGIAVANQDIPVIFYTAVGLAALLGLLAITVPFRPKGRTVSS